MSSRHVTTTCVTTRPRVTRLIARLVLPRPPSRRTWTTLARDDIHAGSSPETTAASSVTATVTPSTLPSMSNVIHAGGAFCMFRMVLVNQSTARYASADADRRANARQHQALGQHLADQPGAGGAERRPDRQFPRAERRPRELHVHHVEARDQQDAGAERQHRPHQALQLRARELVDEPQHLAVGERLVRVRVGRGKAPGERRHLGAGALDRHPWLEQTP